MRHKSPNEDDHFVYVYVERKVKENGGFNKLHVSSYPHDDQTTCWGNWHKACDVFYLEDVDMLVEVFRG